MTNNAVFAPESDLLLHCGRTTLDAAAKNHLTTLSKSHIDWNLLLRAAESHGLTGLAYWHLKS
ncbi:MAG TPA: hypothetical protein V6C72_15850, partial [Chroococcales cyanobacterium]